MQPNEEILKQIRASFEREPHIDPHRHHLAMTLDNGVLTLEGEVADIAAKKLALELCGATHGVRGIVDRLRVAPSERKGDGAIRTAVSAFLLQEPALRNIALRTRHKGREETLRAETAESAGNIEISVEDGIITLDGEVLSLSHKRLAGVLAWWTPGRKDVVNGLEVVPPEQDSDDEIADALRLALEKDPLVHADQISVSADNYVVTLEGLVGTDEERKMAELDAWYIFAVDKVINRIEVGK